MSVFYVFSTGEGVKVVCLWLYYCSHHMWHYNRARLGAGGGGVESGITTLRVGDRGNASFLFWNLVCRFQHDGYIYRNSNLRVYAKNTFNAAWVYRMGKRSTQASPLQQHLYKFKVMYFFASNVSRNVAKSWCPLLCVGFRPGDIVFFLVTNILHNYICLYGDYFLSKK